VRSAAEIRFRLAQEAWNLWLLWRQPSAARSQRAAIEGLPDPADVVNHLRGSVFAEEIVRLAEEIRTHRFPIFGQVIETSPQIAWRRDYVHGKESGLDYFRRIPYLDFDRAGDHKMIWELNRHQHLVVLAQAFLFTGRREFIAELEGQLKSWWDANPFQRGINWASALEVGFRALSWMWVYHLAGASLEAGIQDRLLTELSRHGLHLEHNLSIYFSPNTHLLGEAVALHALGVLFNIDRWRRVGASIVEQQMDRQVRADGAHFEQSSYYHIYALDLFQFHAVLSSTPDSYRQKLAAMAEYLDALLGPGGSIPCIGDDDGGRLFHPYGERSQFGRATLATSGRPREESDLHEQAAWWGVTGISNSPRPPRRSRLFKDSGLAVIECGDVQILVKAGSFGANRAGHSHSDCLSIVVRRGGEDILIDPGTYTYVADAQARAWFRGAAAHNTVRIEGRDQAAARPQFGWLSKPEVSIQDWRSTEAEDLLEATARYDGFGHRRRVSFRKPHELFVIDEIDGPPGTHLIEQFWHPMRATPVSKTCFQVAAGVHLILEAEAESEKGWYSAVFGQRVERPVIVVRRHATLPLRLAATLDFSGGALLKPPGPDD
jgi:heparinase II/III-like protein